MRFADVQVTGAIADQTRDNQLRIGVGAFAFIAGFVGYVLRSLTGPENKCRRDLRRCHTAISDDLRRRVALKRRDAVNIAVKKIKRIHEKQRRKLH